MSDSKTYVFGSEGGMQGLDPNILLANGGGFGNGMWNNPIWAIVFLAALRNGGIFGNGGTDTGFISSQLGQAIAGNANAINNLSTHLDCTVGQVQSGIAAVQAAVQNVANQTGMNAMQIINAVNSGNCAVTNALQSCCCDLKTAINTQGYEGRINNLQQSQLIQNGFSQVGYAAAEQTCAIKQNATDNTNRVIAKLDAIEDGRKDREIASLTAALTAANSRAERQAELAPIYKALADIQCKQPNVVTVPANNGVLVPSCVAWNLGLQNLGLGAYGTGGNGFL